MRFLLRSAATISFSPRFSPNTCLLTWRGAEALGELSSCRTLKGERLFPPDVTRILLPALRLAYLLPATGAVPAGRAALGVASQHPAGDGGRSASPRGAAAGSCWGRAATGDSLWAPKASLSCSTRRCRLSLSASFMGVREMPGVGDRGSAAGPCCGLGAAGELSTSMGVRRMPALGERGSRTCSGRRARGGAGVAGALPAAPMAAPRWPPPRFKSPARRPPRAPIGWRREPGHAPPRLATPPSPAGIGRRRGGR